MNTGSDPTKFGRFRPKQRSKLSHKRQAPLGASRSDSPPVIKGAHGPKFSEDPPFLDQSQAAQRLGENEQRVVRLAASGQLAGYEFEGRWRLVLSLVDAFIINRTLEQGHDSIRRKTLARCPSQPYAYRRYLGMEAIAGLDGRPLSQTRARHNGDAMNLAVFRDPRVGESTRRRRTRTFSELCRMRAKLVAIYRLTELFSDTDMTLIDARFHAITACQWAAAQGVSRQAAYERLARIRVRARAAGLRGWRQL